MPLLSVERQTEERERGSVRSSKGLWGNRREPGGNRATALRTGQSICTRPSCGSIETRRIEQEETKERKPS